MSDIAIKIDNLSKRYRLGLVGSDSLKDDLLGWWYRIRGKEDPTINIGDENRLDTQSGNYVWALKDINLEVKQGEVLGIIGKNGAGKSTLLKILSRVTGPTTGEIKTVGRIASLLEVGTGMHPELTGRENIFINGAVLGMTKAEIKRKFDEIVDFAGVARYIDTPVKRYSSGMNVRLGFAVAAFLEPEILIVDEVLAVGDADFQKKAIGKMKDVTREGGRTVLFVSHNMHSIRSLCSNALLINEGKITKRGVTNEIIETYLNTSKQLIESKSIKNRSDHQGNGEIRVTKILLYNKNNEIIQKICVGQSFKISLEYEILDQELEFNFISVSIGFVDSKGQFVFNHSNSNSDSVYSSKEVKHNTCFNIKVENININKGDYYLYYSIYNGNHNIDSLSDAILIQVEDSLIFKNKINPHPYFGAHLINAHWFLT